MKNEYSITFLIEILTRSNVYTDVQFSYKECISIFLLAIVLPIFSLQNVSIVLRVLSRALLVYFSGSSPTNHWSYSKIGLLIQWSRPVYRKSYILQDYRYTSRVQCVVSPTFCWYIDILAKTSVSLVLHFAGLLIH